ncbi:VPLPA-CTERM sorting domain-containing protein [Rhodobacterales bacterium HKCCE3408]|nr:VPLPA-CTERM sorting domain-containing protein [Rhodobacterales bacterium HKCCE3408]
MKTFKLALAFAALLTGAASAAPVTIDLTGYSGPAATFSGSAAGANFLIDADNLSRRQSGDYRLFNDASAMLDTAGGTGLGVLDTDDTSPDIDGLGGNNVIFFLFDRTVRLLGATFSNVDSVDDVVYAALDAVPPGDFAAGFLPIEVMAGRTGILSVSDNGRFFAFGGLQNNDIFRLNSITVAAVPVPAGLPLLAAALGGLAFFRRRKV